MNQSINLSGPLQRRLDERGVFGTRWHVFRGRAGRRRRRRRRQRAGDAVYVRKVQKVFFQGRCKEGFQGGDDDDDDEVEGQGQGRQERDVRGGAFIIYLYILYIYNCRHLYVSGVIGYGIY